MRRIALAAVIAMIALAALWVVRDRASPDAAADVAAPQRATPGPPPPRIASEPAREAPRAAPPRLVHPPPEEGSLLDELFPSDDPAWSWARVDLDALRDELPDNAFWELAAPTDNLRVQERRRELRERWNRELGKILSNTATEEEIRAYYGERRRISTDYVIFTTRLLDAYRDTLPERDVGLIELARTLHRARLEEIPRRVSEAIARHEEHERFRQRWLADQETFGTAP